MPIAALALSAGAAFAPATARGQIFVGIEGSGSSGSVGEYNPSGTSVGSLVSSIDFPSPVAVSGSNMFVGNSFDEIGLYVLGSTPGTVSSSNSSLISSLSDPVGIAISGSDLFSLNISSGTIGEYTTSGTVVKASLVTGLNESPSGIAISGSELFVANAGNGTISEFTLGSTPGTVTSSNLSLVTGLNGPQAIAASGSYLFVTDGPTTNVVGEFTTSGTSVNGALVTGLTNAFAIALSGSNLYVANDTATGTVGQYTLGSTPGTVTSSNPSLISMLNHPIGIALPMGVPPGTSSASTSHFAGVPSGSTVDPLALDSNGDPGLSNTTGELTFSITDDTSVFVSVTLPSTGTGSLDVSVGSVDLGEFADGSQIVFADYASQLGALLVNDPGVQGFEISGLSGVTNFPLELDFNDASASFTVTTPVPEPASFGLLCATSVLLIVRSRRGRQDI
jgi:hypothetical protein